MSARSAIWNYFTESENNPDKATCNSCKNVYSCKGGTTSSLINHLCSKHKDIHDTFLKGKKRPSVDVQPSVEPRTKQAKLEDCIPLNEKVLNDKFEDAMVDFLAESGVAFKVVELDSFKNLINVANKRVKVKHRTTYSKLIKVKAEEIKKELFSIIEAVKEDLNCVAFTTDMWTSRAGTPFMSLTLHFIDKSWSLYRFTPYVAPFPARHTGLNISVGLDAMIEELGLDDGDWELFSVNDNAANVKLGIKLSTYLKEYFCSIHTLELAVKDTFSNVPGMSAVVKKTKALAKYVHKSTPAKEALKNEAKKESLKFRQLVNPPDTRWSGYHDNLASVLHLKKPLMTLMASQDNWAEHELSGGDWKLIEGAVQLLQSVRCTVKTWEAEKVPTMHTVIERLYNMHAVIDEFIACPRNNRYGIGFARELKKNIEHRFPNTGTDEKLRRISNYLAPQFKGIHLEEAGKLYSTKKEIEEEVNSHEGDQSAPVLVGTVPDVETAPLSPTSRLRKKLLERQQRTIIEGVVENRKSQLQREFHRYESFSLPSNKTIDILKWWKSHASVLPLLSNLAKKVLTVPASSSKSERVFSTGGNIVTSKRNRLDPSKVENLIVIKENKGQIEDFKKAEEYELKECAGEPFKKVSVDKVLATMQAEEMEDMFAADSESEEDYETDSDDESEVDEETDIDFEIDL